MATIINTKESDHIGYRSSDGSRWEARRATQNGVKGFMICPDGDRARDFFIAAIQYITWDGTGWSAEWVSEPGTNTRYHFYHNPLSPHPLGPHRDPEIAYRIWDIPGYVQCWKSYWVPARNLFHHDEYDPDTI